MKRPAPPELVLVGGGGMLGRAFAALLEARGIAYAAPSRTELDVTRAESVRTGLDAVRTGVLNCAAYTDVDGAEADEAGACAVNADGVRHLTERCDELGVPLLHFSTDYVFDGQGKAPYRTDDATDPVNAYGRSKALGERALLASPGRHLLVRTSWLYAPWGKNFVQSIARLATERPKLNVVNDQRGRPTSAEHLAATALSLLLGGAHGIYHVTDGGSCTWYELAKATVEIIGAPCAVEPCTSDAFPRPAKRPAYSVLDLAKTEARLGPMPDWRGQVARVLSASRRRT